MNILCQIIIAATITGVTAFPADKLEEQQTVKEHILNKKLGRNRRVTKKLQNKVFFTSFLEPITVAQEDDSIVLECMAAGTPPPTIHWLKNGIKIKQVAHQYFHDEEAAYEHNSVSDESQLLKLGGTASKLYLGCLTFDDEATYTCVADTPYERTKQETFVKVRRNNHRENKIDGKCLSRVEETNDIQIEEQMPQITMWTTRRLEIQGANVQLFCRASGTPAPKITWRDRKGRKIKRHRHGFKILRNGDLLIKRISWLKHLGDYTCIAENSAGRDQQKAFLYPAAAA